MKHQTRILIAGTLGNLIESFDMAICGLLSIYLAKYLMGDVSKGLVLVFFTFFAGYLARPFGAFVMGMLSDLYGRKITLAASILSMGIATALIGFIPPNSSIGATSAGLLLALRIIQSFSCGGEYLNSSAYLVENADPHSKGYAGSWASFGAMAGVLSASITVFIVTRLSNHYPELDWFIWRVPFIFALLGSSIGLYIRLCIPESMEYIMYYAERPSPKFSNLFQASMQYLKSNPSQAWYVFILSCLGVTTTFQIYIYGPMQADLSGLFSDQDIMMSNVISLIILLCIFPIMGRLSDRIPREKIVMTACAGFLVLSIPFFHYLSHGNLQQLVLFQGLIAIPAGAYYATVPVMLAEMFPINLRCTVLSMLYSTAASLSAGLTPVISLLLIDKTDVAASPAVLIFGLVLMLCFGVWFRKAKPNTCLKKIIST